MIAMPDPTTFAVLPWRPEEQGVARMFCDILTPERTPYEGDPRHVLRRALERVERDGLRHVQRRRRARVLPLPGPQRHRGRSTRAATSTSRRSTPAPTCAARPSSRSSSSASTSSTRHHEGGPSQHEIDMRYADALKMADDCMTYRITVKEYAHEVRLARDVHAQAARSARTARACTRTCRSSRTAATRSSTPTTRTSSRDVGHGFIAGQLRHARELSVDLRPVGQLLQAARPGLRGAGLRRVEPAQPQRARARPALPPGQGAGTHGAALPRPGVQPVPDVRGAAAGRPRGHREGLRAARADGEEPLPPVARRPAPPRDRAAARDARRGDRDRPPSPSSSCARSASTCSTASSRSSARSGRTTACRSRSGSSTATCRSCERAASGPAVGARRTDATLAASRRRPTRSSSRAARASSCSSSACAGRPGRSTSPLAIRAA